jgi:hypothetical protein
VALAGCASASIAAKEAMGYAKRDQLVSAVEKAQTDQQEAKVQFENALEEFLSLAEVKPSKLESVYRTLEKELKRSEAKAGDVRTRIKDIERVANALFKEWNAELKTYSSAELRRASEQQLNDTKRQYEQLLGVMRQAESRMEPVLAVFRDQVLFLKHNLNAQAIASLEGTFGQLESDIGTLVAEMERSIAEADAFIANMGK